MKLDLGDVGEVRCAFGEGLPVAVTLQRHLEEVPAAAGAHAEVDRRVGDAAVRTVEHDDRLVPEVALDVLEVCPEDQEVDAGEIPVQRRRGRVRHPSVVTAFGHELQRQRAHLHQRRVVDHARGGQVHGRKRAPGGGVALGELGDGRWDGRVDVEGRRLRDGALDRGDDGVGVRADRGRDVERDAAGSLRHRDARGHHGGRIVAGQADRLATRGGVCRERHRSDGGCPAAHAGGGDRDRGKGRSGHDRRAKTERENRQRRRAGEAPGARCAPASLLAAESSGGEVPHAPPSLGYQWLEMCADAIDGRRGLSTSSSFLCIVVSHDCARKSPRSSPARKATFFATQSFRQTRARAQLQRVSEGRPRLPQVLGGLREGAGLVQALEKGPRLEAAPGASGSWAASSTSRSTAWTATSRGRARTRRR